MAGEAPTDKSMFHGKNLKDYAGRSWLEAPKDLKAENEHCFLPKRWIHTWSGHTKGVNAIRYTVALACLLGHQADEHGHIEDSMLSLLILPICSLLKR